MKTLKMSLVISSLLFTSSCYADNIADTIASLQKQIDALKKEVAAVHNNSKALEKEIVSVKDDSKALKQEIVAVQDNSDAIESELSKKSDSSVKMNGYMDAYYGAYSGVNTNDGGTTQNGFRIYRFSLIPNQQITKNLRWLAELEFENGPRVNTVGLGQIFMERAYMQYDINPMLKVRLGRDFMHSTVWSDNHYPTFILPESRPLSERKIFGHINDGVEVLGNTLVGGIPFDYIAYAGNGNSYQGAYNVNKENVAGARVRVQLPIGSFNRISLAASTGGIVAGADAITTVGQTKNQQDNIGVSLEQKFAGFDLQAQYSRGKVDKGAVNAVVLNPSYTQIGYYANLSYMIYNFTPWFQYDVFKDNSTLNTEINHRRLSYGLQYSVNSNLKLKLEHQRDNTKTTGVADATGNSTLFAAALYF